MRKGKAKTKTKTGDIANPKRKSSLAKARRKSTSVLLSDVTTAAATSPVKPKAEKAKKKQDAKKAKDGKVVRDSFTMPKVDYDRIDTLKEKFLGLGVAVKKTELLRAGLAALAGLADDKLVAAVRELVKVKTGRPLSDKKKKVPKGRKR